MIIEDSLTIRVPNQVLWDYLLDIERMSVCIPGAEQVKRVEADVYEGVFRVKVGPIAASFGGRARILETAPPARLVARGEAKDARTASLASATFSADMRPLPDGATEIAYKVDVSLLGKLGNFGQPVMREIARRLTGEFVRCVEAQLVPPDNGASAPADTPAPSAAPPEAGPTT